jgi:hypothetical protein
MGTRLSGSAQISATVGLLKEFRGAKFVVRKVNVVKSLVV